MADEIRGMATIGRHFAGNVYEVERAHRLMELAAKVAALAEGTPVDEVRAHFDAEPWFRATPAVGVDAAVFNPEGAILLVRRKDNGRWATPGGIAEVGQTLPESALRELWEEAGLRGRVVRLVALFDGRKWGSRSKVHLVHCAFEVACDDLVPSPGIEMLDARFFPPDDLPAEMHHGHDARVRTIVEMWRSGGTYSDPAASYEIAMPMHQRPAE